jgi:UDPglucose 6-dehydrogenase
MTLPHLPIGTTILISSQMPVGSVRQLESIAFMNYPEKQLGFACMPENLRLGKAIDIFLNPDRIVVGVRNERDRMIIHNLLCPITSRIEWMGVESAEMTKHAINAFLAISVTFANELASICEAVGADAKEVERGLKSEIRIGPKAYLSPGAAFAGGTLARDISYLTKISKGFELKSLLLNAVKFSNDEHKNWAKRKIELCCSTLAECNITIWGLTYKPGTNTLRRSMAVELCEWLIMQGASINVHDPVVKDLPESWSGKVKVFENAVEALEGAQILVLSTEWPIYKEIDSDSIAQVTNNLIIIDANHFLSQIAKDSRFKYFAVGVPA